jgi:hypothetical protein
MVALLNRKRNITNVNLSYVNILQNKVTQIIKISINAQ